MSDVKVSIIIPVYNSERYLTRCIESIIKQSYKNLEIIFINDGSSDNTLNILNKYYEEDERIILINQKNSGVSSSRNRGIRESSGEYITFVDSDDWIDHDTIQTALNYLLEYDLDILMWSYIREFNNKSLKKNIYKDDFIYFNESDIKDKLVRKFLGPYKQEMANPENLDALNPVCTKIYKTSLIKKNNFKFEDLAVIGSGEDGLFNLEVFYKAKKIAFINKHFYHYFKNNPSSSTSNYKNKLPEQWLKLFGIMYSNINDRDMSSEYYEALNNRVCLSILGIGLNLCVSDMSSREKIKNIKNIITSERYREAYCKLSLRYFPIHWKIFYLFAKLNFATGVYLLVLIIRHLKRRR